MLDAEFKHVYGGHTVAPYCFKQFLIGAMNNLTSTILGKSMNSETEIRCFLIQ